MKRSFRRFGIGIAAISVGVLLAACSSSPSPGNSAATTSTTASSPTLGTESPSTPAPIYEVSTGHVSGLGTVLVDGQGFTLYLFVPDKQSGSSTCYGACAQGWPPLLLPTGVGAPVAGSGVQSSLLGTTKRTDGTTEITYNKWPLYLWVRDSEPGQATGQALNNLGGVWYAISPNGQAITKHL